MHPEGSLRGYLESLQRLRDLAAAPRTRSRWCCPGTARRSRTRSARSSGTSPTASSGSTRYAAAVAAGAGTAAEVVAIVYADVDRTLWPAAELSVRAQLAYLADRA